jgi:hypothetical protein
MVVVMIVAMMIAVTVMVVAMPMIMIVIVVMMAVAILVIMGHPGALSFLSNSPSTTYRGQSAAEAFSRRR